MEIWDRRTLEKVATIEGLNTSHCNPLIHVNPIEHLYAASWRPRDAELFPFWISLSPAPKPTGNAATPPPATPDEHERTK
ncbi:hypothetical protein PTTG_26899 [Puccinia triticina 1-1 BBBD Race 1]|uniref:Uncharacterized protein n=2 Tax=Puccinia triticina TaxID=208348 RepID=A0A180GPC5_PUCT1|nr:uncharacterized protein PtA15_12A246 [Puccinia triticina]OAV94667.1 hypothetical protein PTTG_26899 [Puccinia triticina 1-1 BBBD Race 1]WAQ90258.1 hypothetical protein PtA15_12A246 [Puccinia triticina]WAR61566.1 hypothetical protein PtB15_12B256 [Puccinia triticina]